MSRFTKAKRNSLKLWPASRLAGEARGAAVAGPAKSATSGEDRWEAVPEGQERGHRHQAHIVAKLFFSTFWHPAPAPSPYRRHALLPPPPLLLPLSPTMHYNIQTDFRGSPSLLNSPDHLIKPSKSTKGGILPWSHAPLPEAGGATTGHLLQLPGTLARTDPCAPPSIQEVLFRASRGMLHLGVAHIPHHADPEPLAELGSNSLSYELPQRFQTQHFPIRAVFLPLNLKSPVLFFGMS